MKFKSNSRLYLSLLPLIILGLLSVGQIFYKIHCAINEEVYSNNKPRKVKEVTPKNWGVSYQNVSFETSNNLKVKGWFIDKKDTSQAIIFAPGKGANKWDVLRYAPVKYLYESDFDILLFDPQSTGGSEGKRYGFGYFEAQDIVHAVKFLRENKGETKVGVWGCSAGASATIMAALESPILIDAVVADSPYANLKIAISNYENQDQPKLSQTLFPFYLEIGKFVLGFDVAAKTNLLNRIKNLSTPIFLIHGLKDKVLSPKNSKLLYENTNQPKKLWLVEKAGHVGSYRTFPKEYKKRVTSFFGKHLSEKSK